MTRRTTFRLLACRTGAAGAVAIPVVGDRTGAGLQGQGDQTFAPVTSRHTDLGEPAGGEVLRPMQPPVVPRAAGLPERAGLHAQDTAPRAEGCGSTTPGVATRALRSQSHHG